MSRTTFVLFVISACITLTLSMFVLHYRYDAISFKSRFDNTNKLLNLANYKLSTLRKQQKELSLLDKLHTEELNKKEYNNETLRHQLIAGTRNIYVRGKCSVTSSRDYNSPKGLQYDTPIELSADAEQIFVDLRENIIRDNEKLSFLQKYVREECN